MGTSQSSHGPGANVSLVPPWAELSDHLDNEKQAQEDINDELDQAPCARFRGTRRALGKFVDSGDIHYLQQALSHYVKTGYGGSAIMGRRLQSTAIIADRLNAFFQADAVNSELWDTVISSGNDAVMVLDTIVEIVSPIDGTLDRESSRRSIYCALSDLLDHYPNTEIVNLTDRQREFVIERYVAYDVYNRFCLDNQRNILENASDVRTVFQRLTQIQEYIVAKVAYAFKNVRKKIRRVKSSDIITIIKQVLYEVSHIFESA